MASGRLFCISATLVPDFSRATLTSACLIPKSFCAVVNASIVRPISSTRTMAARVLSSSSPIRLESKKVKTPMPSKSNVKIPEEIIISRLESLLVFDTVSDNAINLSSLDSKESMLSEESKASLSLPAIGFFSFASVFFLSFVAMFSTQAIIRF